MSVLTDSVYLIRRVKQGPSVPGAVVLYPKRAQPAKKQCSACLLDSASPPGPLTVEAFSDLQAIDSECRCFLPSGPPLMTWRASSYALASSLSGVVHVDVGFRTWDQTRVEEGELFVMGPLLGALYVNAVCPTAVDVRGRAIRNCGTCGRQQVDWAKILDRAQDLRLSAALWPATDVFLIDGGNQSLGVCITGSGLTKLGEYQDSLDLRKLDWF